MKLQWLGTAGFRFKSKGGAILIDPYLSRNQEAAPAQPLKPDGLGQISHIFVSHGHFDHLMDVPDIARATGARVVCSPGAARTLAGMGLERNRIQIIEREGQKIHAGPFTAQAFYSTHVRFDLRLVARTLVRMGGELFRIIPLFRDYPCGQVISWRIKVQGRSVQFFGSAGATARELLQLARAGTIDLLLVPLQGHSRICGIGLAMVRALNPAMVIPHHHDDFYPPLSQAVDIRPFVDGMLKMPWIDLKLLNVNQEISL